LGEYSRPFSEYLAADFNVWFARKLDILMFNPKCRILLMSKAFPRDKVVCLGTQLISIVNSIKGFLPQHIWYGADVEAVGKNVKKHKLNGIRLNIIGTDSQFIEYCSEIEQFIWGDFLCIDSNFSSKNIQNIELETEDVLFRSINCEGVLLEIRAFDTTCFEIYSEHVELIKNMSKMYDVDVEYIK
jgi:hypothetical protein